MRSICSLAFLVAALALHAPSSASLDDPAPLSEWASETIELPPGFAPGFPSGVEHLRFPPGWRNPDSENFWSYAIVIRLDEPLPDAARVEALMAEYYTGLMSAFGVGSKEGSPPNDVRVVTNATENNRFDLTMNLIDGFATFEPVKVRLKIESEPLGPSRSELRVRASLQPDAHAIWDAMDGAIRDIREQHPDEATDARPSPMAYFARMIEGEWRLGERQFDTWRWGPGGEAGGHSVIGRTMGLTHDGESTSGVLRVLYWHPGREEISLLALSPGGIRQGVATPDGDDVLFDLMLFYKKNNEMRKYLPEDGTRALITAWRFDGPDAFDAVWIEDMGSRDPAKMPSWRYERAERITPDPVSASNPPAEVEHFTGIETFIGNTWEATIERTNGASVRRTIEFSWVPYVEAVHIQIHE